MGSAAKPLADAEKSLLVPESLAPELLAPPNKAVHGYHLI